MAYDGESQMLQNWVDSGESGGGVGVRRLCDTLSMKMDKVRGTEDQHSQGKISVD